MKRLFGSVLVLGILVLGLMSCCSGPLVHQERVKLSTSQLVNHDGGATVALVYQDIENDDDEVSDVSPYCTGVWVSRDTILTAYHCVGAAKEATEQMRKDKERLNSESGPPGSLEALLRQLQQAGRPHTPDEPIPALGLPMHYILENEVAGWGKEPTAWHLSTVLEWDEDHDLALLHAEGKAIPPHAIAKLADETPAVGEHLHIVGHTRGMYWTYLEGTVAAYRNEVPHSEMQGPFLQVSAPVFFGNSGGGAFNDYGELVGIADFIVKSPNTAFFVHVDNIRVFLQHNDIIK